LCAPPPATRVIAAIPCNLARNATAATIERDDRISSDMESQEGKARGGDRQRLSKLREIALDEERDDRNAFALIRQKWPISAH